MNFSVLMSVYKKENPEYFDLAMKSIWDDQILKPNEIVLVQDGELTDELYKVVEKWINKLGDRLILVKLKQNVGFAKALNEGLKYCNFDLVARMDTDDISKPERFKKQIKFMIKNPNICCCGSYVEEFNDNFKQVIKLPLDTDTMLNFIKLRNPICHPSVIFRKSIIEEVGGYPENLRLGQDYGLWSILLARGYRIENIPEVLLRLRANNDFFKRRGWDSFKYEVLVLNIQYNENLINIFQYSKAFSLRFLLRLSPVFLKKLAYKLLRKEKNEL
jgi:glycosyltransferase involved in cell wall biosynthesis